MRRSALSPRGAAGPFEDLASRGRLIQGQRVDRYRLKRRVARRARHVARCAGLLAVGATVLGAVAVGGGWLLRSPRFAVTSVEVSGLGRLDRDVVRRLMILRHACFAVELAENVQGTLASGDCYTALTASHPRNPSCPIPVMTTAST